MQKSECLYLQVCLTIRHIDSQSHISQEFLHPALQRERERYRKFSSEIPELGKTQMGFRHSLRVCNKTGKSGGLQPFWTGRRQLGGFTCELKLQGEEMQGEEGMGWECAGKSLTACTAELCWITRLLQRDITAICELCCFPNSHFCHKLQGSPQADCLSLAAHPVKLNSLHSAAS